MYLVYMCNCACTIVYLHGLHLPITVRHRALQSRCLGQQIGAYWTQATNRCILSLLLPAETQISNVLDKMRRRRPWWTNINLHKSDAASFCVVDFVPWMKMRIRSTYLCVFFYILFLLFYFFCIFLCSKVHVRKFQKRCYSKVECPRCVFPLTGNLTSAHLIRFPNCKWFGEPD